jgi:hypothetical protein
MSVSRSGFIAWTAEFRLAIQAPVTNSIGTFDF